MQTSVLKLINDGYHPDDYGVEVNGKIQWIPCHVVWGFVERVNSSTVGVVGELDLELAKKALKQTGKRVDTKLLEDLVTHRFVQAGFERIATNETLLVLDVVFLHCELNPSQFKYQMRSLAKSNGQLHAITTFDVVCTEEKQLRKLLPNLRILEGE